MEHTFKSLIGFKMKATDGEFGEVKDFYFDDETWAIRYLVIETGNWFSNKKVLIIPKALLAPDWLGKCFPTELTIEQIKSSPDIDTDKPVSRQQEIEMYGHYSWQRYGGLGFYAGSSPIIGEEILKENDSNQGDYDLHLRSAITISDYYIKATDGDIGHVKDLIIDTEAWKIKDLVIDTHNLIGGHKVVLSVDHVKEIQWVNYKILIDLQKEYLKESPAFIENNFVYPTNIFEL